MNPFDEDPFENILREFFGRDSFGRTKVKNNIISGEEDERNIDFIQTDAYVYLIFELPGYKKEDISVNIRGQELIIKAKSKEGFEKESYVHQKMNTGMSITKLLPKFVITKGYKTTFNNGILEICFKKK